jgi:hypothetical protein
VWLPCGSGPMGATPGYHSAHIVAGPASQAGAQTCSTAATLVIRVTYRVASSSIWEGVNNKIEIHPPSPWLSGPSLLHFLSGHVEEFGAQPILPIATHGQSACRA